MDLWPDDIRFDDLRAAAELEAKNARLSAEVVEANLSDRVMLSFQVNNRAVPLTLNLFDVFHQFDAGYPAVIDPPDDKIPGFLQRKSYVPGMGDLRQMTHVVSKIMTATGSVQENPWVCGTPREFTTKLRQLLAEDRVKVRIINLLSAKPRQAQLVPTVEAPAS
ncbi:MAG: hypothetical protein NT069_35070 [Planctomycetota bacterium]|nr:hypothetical protein [Planctomycetota bacterium]